MRANSVLIADIFVRHYVVVGLPEAVYVLELLTPKAIEWAYEREFTLNGGGVLVSGGILTETLENLNEKGLFYYAAEGLPGFVYTSR